MPGDIKPSAITEALYFAGCRATKGKATVAAAAARLMAISGLPFRTMDDECCCGLYLVTIGKIKEAREIARANIEGIKATGAKKVVFSCAECYKAFKVDYPKLLGISTSDLPFQPVHLSEELDTALRCGRLKFTRPIEMTVTYHDACALGRMSEPWIQWEGERREWGVMEPKRQIRRGTNGIYEPPRNLLRAIPSLKLVEMPRHHENAWCCGNAGGVREAFPDLAVWTASERLREAQHVKTEAVVAACPGCCDNLGDAAQNGNGSMEVFEFHDFLLRAL
jgi:Fe-S oxidoreductase